MYKFINNQKICLLLSLSFMLLLTTCANAKDVFSNIENIKSFTCKGTLVSGSINEYNNFTLQYTFKNGKLYGHNTDWQGFITDLKSKKINLKNKRVLVIGAGGAAKAILYSLNKLKVKQIYLTSRTFDKAKLISKKYKNISVIDINKVSADFLENIDCLVNCSTCGMKKGDKLPFTIKEFNKDIVFYDIIYNKETPFKIFAAKNKIKYFSGEGMLIYQGAVSFDKWTGIFPDTKNTLSLIKKFMR